MMKCNPEKTKLIHFSSKFKNVSSSFKIFADGHEVKLVEDAVDLGVILDSSLNMKKQVSKLCSSASITIRKISSISKFLDRKVLERLVHAFISTKLDYCNSILYGLPGGEIQRVQRIQNAAVTKCKIQDHISPILDQLHWLTIKNRIVYKLLLLTFKSLFHHTPSYLYETLVLQHHHELTTLTDQKYFNNRNFMYFGTCILDLLKRLLLLLLVLFLFTKSI